MPIVYGGAGGSGGGNVLYAKVTETQASGTAAGTAAVTTWTTRTLNTVDSDIHSIVSLASNQITLQAGTYVIEVKCPMYVTNHSRARFYNVTDSAVALLGVSMWGNNAATGNIVCPVVGIVAPTSAKAYRVEYYQDNASPSAGNSLGVASSIASVSEVYTTVEIWKIA